jgi:hypothetical protein
MKFYWLILGILAVWRVTHLLQAEDGPWDAVFRLRRFVGNGFWGKLLDCFYCLSIWIAAPCAWIIGENWRERVFLWLSFSGGASLLDQFTRQKVAPAAFVEEPSEERDYGMLRTKEDPSDAAGSSNPSERKSS